ncbi:Calcineurin subunit B type 2 [Armadillidium vulgare]|nr:Calcineurin subunit B type 2 [Armadillidium vulgare]
MFTGNIYIPANNSKKNGGGENVPGATFHEITPQFAFSEETKYSSVVSSPALFEALGYSQQDKDSLYEEFIRLSFPFKSLIFPDIKPLITELGYNGRESDIFRAFDEHHSGELDIHQFILSLMAMDPMTQHGQGPGEFRCRHIFRYYDEDSDGFLDEKEILRMVKDIADLLKQNLSEEKLKINVQNALKVFGVNPSEKVPMINFLTSVGSLRFRGTSLLFRATESVPSVIRNLIK